MPTINADIVYKKPNKPKKISGQPISEDQLKALIDGVNACLKASDPAEFKGFMNKQVGPFANYPHKQDVMQGLKIIYDKFFDEQTEDSQKTMIAGRLLERAGACEEGFHNGVNMLIMGFNLAKNIGELVQQIKQSLVAETASELTDEVHSYNRCFIVASELYGVQPINQDDKYRGNIEDSTFEGKLSEKFAKLMQPLAMLGALEEAISDQLTSFGMESDTLTSDHLEGVKSYFLALFSDHVTVKAWVEAKQAFDAEKKSRLEETKGINDLFDQWVDQDQSAKAVLGNDPNHSKRSAIINFKIGDISTLPTPWLEKTEHFFDTLETSKKEELSKRLSKIEKNRPLLLEKKQQFDEANHSLEELFFIHDEPSEENPNIRSGWRLNSQQIRSLLWQEMLTQHYFQFKQNEEPLFSAIINQNHQDRDMSNFALYIAQNNAYEQIVYLNTDQQKSLINQIKKMNSNKPKLVYDRYIQICLQYLSPESRSLAWELIPNLSQFIASAKDLGWLKYLNAEQSQSVVEILLNNGKLNKGKIKNEIDFNWAKSKYPELEDAMLMHLASLDKDKQAKCLMGLPYGFQFSKPHKICSVLIYAFIDRKPMFESLFETMANNHLLDNEINNQKLLSMVSTLGANKALNLLLKKGTDINVHNGLLLRNAASNGQIQTLKFLLDRSAALEVWEHQDKITPLIGATLGQHPEAVKFLLQNKADINARMDNGLNALEIALNSSNTTIQDILLTHLLSLNQEQQAECLMKVPGGPYPNVLGYAYKHRPTLLKALFNKSETKQQITDLLNHEAIESSAILPIAVMLGATEIIDKLLSNNNMTQDTILEAIKVAAREGQIEALGRLLDGNKELDAGHNFRAMALLEAASHRQANVVQWLVQNNADINFKNVYRQNALDIAVENKDHRLIEIILRHLATLDPKLQAKYLGNKYPNVLFFAFNYKEDLFYQLFEQLENNNQLTSLIDDEDENHSTLIDLAIRNRDKDLIKIILKHLANLDKKQQTQSNKSYIKVLGSCIKNELPQSDLDEMSKIIFDSLAQSNPNGNKLNSLLDEIEFDKTIKTMYELYLESERRNPGHYYTIFLKDKIIACLEAKLKLFENDGKDMDTHIEQLNEIYKTTIESTLQTLKNIPTNPIPVEVILLVLTGILIPFFILALIISCCLPKNPYPVQSTILTLSEIKNKIDIRAKLPDNSETNKSKLSFFTKKSTETTVQDPKSPKPKPQ